MAIFTSPVLNYTQKYQQLNPDSPECQGLINNSSKELKPLSSEQVKAGVERLSVFDRRYGFLYQVTRISGYVTNAFLLVGAFSGGLIIPGALIVAVITVASGTSLLHIHKKAERLFIALANQRLASLSHEPGSPLPIREVEGEESDCLNTDGTPVSQIFRVIAHGNETVRDPDGKLVSLFEVIQSDKSDGRPMSTPIPTTVLTSIFADLERSAPREGSRFVFVQTPETIKKQRKKEEQQKIETNSTAETS